MKEVIKKELETLFNTMRKEEKKKRHLNYILPPSDKGNLTYLLSQSLENREEPSTTWRPEHGVPPAFGAPPSSLLRPELQET